jgi:hypothetical protein
VAIWVGKHWCNRFHAAFRAIASPIALLALCTVALPAQAAFNNATPRGTFAGTHNYTITGGTLRRYSNTQDACTLVTNGRSTAAVSGIPAGSTIAAAYRYWGGSGTGNDWVVGFNAGNTLTSTSNITAAAGNRFT